MAFINAQTAHSLAMDYANSLVPPAIDEAEEQIRRVATNGFVCTYYRHPSKVSSVLKAVQKHLKKAGFSVSLVDDYCGCEEALYIVW